MSETAAARQHASTAPATPQPPEPTHAERARTLLSLRSVATLATLSRKHPGFPFGSLMPYALDPSGRPLLLISNMAMHTQNLKADPRSSLFVSQLPTDADPLGAARATLVGEAVPVPPPEIPSARELYLSRHENSRYWIDFADFSLFRLEPSTSTTSAVSASWAGSPHPTTPPLSPIPWPPPPPPSSPT